MLSVLFLNRILSRPTATNGRREGERPRQATTSATEQQREKRRAPYNRRSRGDAQQEFQRCHNAQV